MTRRGASLNFHTEAGVDRYSKKRRGNHGKGRGSLIHKHEDLDETESLTFLLREATEAAEGLTNESRAVSSDDRVAGWQNHHEDIAYGEPVPEFPTLVAYKQLLGNIGETSRDLTVIGKILEV